MWVQMVSDIGGAWMQPVTLCPLVSTGTVWEVSVDPDDQSYWWSMNTAWSLPVTVCTCVYRNSLGSECGSRWSVILVGPGYGL